MNRMDLDLLNDRELIELASAIEDEQACRKNGLGQRSPSIPVRGYPSYRLRDGNVYSLISNRRMKPKVQHGYMCYTLRLPAGGSRTVRYHRILMQTLLNSDLAGLVINHKDGNKLNNEPWNLEAITAADNVRHAFRLGLIPPRKKTGRLSAPRRHRVRAPKMVYQPSAYRGPTQETYARCWRVVVKIDKRRASFGTYHDELEAAYVYDQVVSQIDGRRRANNGLLALEDQST